MVWHSSTQNTHQTLLSSRLCLSEFLWSSVPLFPPPCHCPKPTSSLIQPPRPRLLVSSAVCRATPTSAAHSSTCLITTYIAYRILVNGHLHRQRSMRGPEDLGLAFAPGAASFRQALSFRAPAPAPTTAQVPVSVPRATVSGKCVIEREALASALALALAAQEIISLTKAE